jgi:hypothetical protein
MVMYNRNQCEDPETTIIEMPSNVLPFVTRSGLQSELMFTVKHAPPLLSPGTDRLQTSIELWT